MDYWKAKEIQDKLYQAGYGSFLNSFTASVNGQQVESWTVEAWQYGRFVDEITTPEGANQFIRAHGDFGTKHPNIRYLYCSSCGKSYSADPQHYQGTQGQTLACCGRALQLRVDGGDDIYTIADSVDLEYLSRPHTDQYTNNPPLPVLGARRSLGLAAERTMGTAPKVPAALQPVEIPQSWTPEEAGYLLWVAGYKRTPAAVWLPVNRKSLTAADLTRFEDGDTVALRVDDSTSLPFTTPQTHQRPDTFGIRFTDEAA
jgi:hypothetical protein